MSITSGDPEALQVFVNGSGAIRRALAGEAESAVAAYNAFASTSALSGSLGGLPALVSLLRDLEANESFLRGVAEALAAADAGAPGLASVDDATLSQTLATDGVGVAPAALTVDPSALLGQPPTSGFADDPVCTLTGNFFHPEVDLGFPARSAVLDWRRAYNSLATGVGAFGRGWTCVVDMALTLNSAPSGDAIPLSVRLSDGASLPLAPEGPAAWIPQTRPRLRLRRDPAGGYLLEEGRGSSLRFDASGRLQGWGRGRGEVVVKREPSGTPTRLEETISGRSLSLTWEGGRIIEVTASDGRSCSYQYDGLRLIEASRPAGSMSYAWTGERIASVTDADGVVLVANTYDEEGRVATQTSPFGRVTTYAYGKSRVTVVIGDEGIRNAFVHNASGNLTALIDGDGRAMRMSYDEAGHLTGWRDRRGAAWSVSWAGGLPMARRGPEGFEETFNWDEEGRIVAHTICGDTTRWEYPGPGFSTPSRIVEPGGAVAVLEVSADDLAMRITDADGVAVALDYDADGQTRAITDGVGNTTTLSYDAAGYLTGIRRPSSRTTRFELDAAGRVVMSKEPGKTSTFRWSAAGRGLSGVDAGEGPWSANFGPNGAVSSVTGATRLGASFDYDTSGNVVAITGPDGRVYEQRFDRLGLLVGSADPAGATWTYSRDGEGAVVEILDPDGGQRRREVDLLGRVVAETDAAGREWRRSWGTDGRLGSMVDPGGDRRSWTFDAAGRIAASSDVEGGLWRAQWSPGGRLIGWESASDERTTYTYDAAGRLATVNDDKGSVRFVYDVDGAVVRAIDERGRSVSLERDEVGRIISVTDRRGVVRPVPDAVRPVPQGEVAVPDALGAETRYAFDVAGRLAAVTDPLGGVTAMAYDRGGRLASVVDPLGRVTSLQRNGCGRVVRVDHGDSAVVQRPALASGRSPGFPRLRGLRPQRSGPEVDWPIDARGRITASPAGDLFRHDAAGQLVEWVDGAGEVTSYGYDVGGRLLAEKRGWRQVAYRWDPAGQLLTRVDPDGGRTTYTHDAAGHRVGEASAAGTVEYRWDDGGRLIGILRDGVETAIRVDALGLPLSVGGIQVGWDWSSGAPEVASIGETKYERRAGSLVAVNAAGVEQPVETDWMGSAGAVLDPWGTWPGTGDAPRLGYRGALCVGDLVWLGARVYDPKSRSFLSPDPLPNPPGAPCAAHPYHYAWNDPVSLIDPLGLRPLTQAEFEAWKHRDQMGAFARDWESFKKDPLGDIMMGVVVVAGVGLTIVFPPAGIGMLVGVGVSAGVGVATGTFDPRAAAFQGVVGGAAGVAGVAFEGANALTQAGIGAGTGASGSLAGQEIFTGHVDWGAVALNGGLGGLASELGAKVGLARMANGATEETTTYVNLANPERTDHILYGEQRPDGTWLGGHAWPAAPNKSEFPESWSEARIMHEVSDVATDPGLRWVQQTGPLGSDFTNRGLPSRFYVIGVRGGMTIKVGLEPAGRGIVTGYPLP